MMLNYAAVRGHASSQETKKVTDEGDAECKEEDPVRDELDSRENFSRYR